MTGRVGVHLEPLGRVEVAGRLQYSGAECTRLVVGCVDVINVEVEVDLLWRTCWRSGATWSGASWTASRGAPSTDTVCQSSSA